MRRNLTLEETGVLDLRKFSNADGSYFTIPLGWLFLQGFTPSNEEWGSSEVTSFLKNKFRLFIISNPYNSQVYASTTLNTGSDGEIATFENGDYLYVDEVTDGNIGIIY